MSRKEVRALLRAAQPQSKIIDAMNRPLEKVAPWWEYRDRFVTPERINDGVQFWADHKRVTRAHRRPVPGAAGVHRGDTRASKRTTAATPATTGRWMPWPRSRLIIRRARNSFAASSSNSWYSPGKTSSTPSRSPAPTPVLWGYRSSCPRSTAATRWMRTPTSAATCGMIGMIFWRAWRTTCASTAGSLRVRYSPRPPWSRTRHSRSSRTILSSTRPSPASAARGIKVDLPLPPDTPAVLISAEQRDGPAYRVGFHNFYVLTRYNASARYVMAVNDLALAIARRVQGPVAP